MTAEHGRKEGLLWFDSPGRKVSPVFPNKEQLCTAQGLARLLNTEQMTAEHGRTEGLLWFDSPVQKVSPVLPKQGAAMHSTRAS